MPTSITSLLGPRIRECRRSLRMTQQELAERVYCTKAMISQIERGKALPSIDLLVRIAKVLGERPGYFLDPEDPASERGHPADAAIVEELKRLVEVWE